MTGEKGPEDEWEDLDSWIRGVQALSWDKDAYALEPDSILAADEPGMPGGVSVAALVRSLLDAAVDDLASAHLLAAADRLSPVGIPNLIRGTIELAGVGMWVLTGQQRQGRQERALRVAHDSYFNAGRYFEHLSMDPLTPLASRSDFSTMAARDKAHCQELAAGAGKMGLKKTRVTARVDRTAILQEVDKARGTSLFSRWQLCSGFAHGYSWAPQFFNTKTYTHTMEGGGVLTGRSLEPDSALTLFYWGRKAIEELTGTFDVGRRSEPKSSAGTSLVSSPLPPGQMGPVIYMSPEGFSLGPPQRRGGLGQG